MCYINIMDLNYRKTYGINKPNTTKILMYRFIYICDDGTKKTIINLGDDAGRDLIRIWYYDDHANLFIGNNYYTVNYASHATSSEVVVKKCISNYLGVNNTIAYTPTSDYNPSTKKYVDDLVESKTTMCTDEEVDNMLLEVLGGDYSGN